MISQDTIDDVVIFLLRSRSKMARRLPTMAGASVEESSAPPIRFGDEILLRDQSCGGFVVNELSRLVDMMTSLTRK
jgi:hypothetical protein